MKCTYCGDQYGDTYDHVMPRSYTNNNSFSMDVCVPSCKECNSALGDELLFSIPDRAAFLFNKYHKKYKSQLNQTKWTQEELDELGPTLRSAIEHSHNSDNTIGERLQHLDIIRSSHLTIPEVWDQQLATP